MKARDCLTFSKAALEFVGLSSLPASDSMKTKKKSPVMANQSKERSQSKNLSWSRHGFYSIDIFWIWSSSFIYYEAKILYLLHIKVTFLHRYENHIQICVIALGQVSFVIS